MDLQGGGSEGGGGFAGGDLKEGDPRGRDLKHLDPVGPGGTRRHCCGSFIFTASDLLDDDSNNQ